MTDYTLYLVSVFLGGGGAWMVSKYACRLGLMDRPNERSSHCSPTPKGGGIGILAAFLLAGAATQIAVTILLTIALLSLLAFCGDRIDLSPILRLCAQSLLVCFLVLMNGSLPANILFLIPWAVFWIIFIVGTANFYNFMDGINGIAGVTGVIGFLLLAFYIYLYDGSREYYTIALCIALSCIGFLPLNIPTARVFMGDIGSILLGSVFAVLIFLSAGTFLDFTCMTSFLLPVYADELTTMLVRLRDGERLTQAHRRHLYQLLANEKKIPHWKVTIAYGIAQALAGLSAVLVRSFGSVATLSLLLLLFVAFAYVSSQVRSSVTHASG